MKSSILAVVVLVAVFGTAEAAKHAPRKAKAPRTIASAPSHHTHHGSGPLQVGAVVLMACATGYLVRASARLIDQVVSPPLVFD